MSASAERIGLLREQIRRLEQPAAAREQPILSSGCEALDRLLPRQGIVPGTLIEWLVAAGGSGAATLALIVARQAAMEGGAIVVVDRRRDFYPPTAAALGIDLERLVVIRPLDQQDEMWALDQTLRCPGVAAVWAPLHTTDVHTLRRLQLAAETGGAVGLLLRPAAVRGQPSWAEVQLAVQPVPGEAAPGEAAPGEAARRVRVEVTRCRGGRRGGWVELEIDELTGALRPGQGQHETGALRLASQPADRAARRRQARA